MPLLVLVFTLGSCNASVVPSASSPSASATPSATALAASPTTQPSAPTSAPTVPQPSIAQLIGQRIVVTFSGATPSAALLGRIRRGEVGGVILFGRHATSVVQLQALTSLLHTTAADAGQPRLLVMIDQEGGDIRRVGWAPPELSATDMGATLGPSAVRDIGRQTGIALAGLGIDVDLAPVADIPSAASSFLFIQRRTFSADAATTAILATSFAQGLADGGVVATMKHFPGLGRADRDTDEWAVTIQASAAAMQSDLLPYQDGIAGHVPMVMLSNAVYPAWDAANAAGWSPFIAGTLLRDQLGFTGVTITDGLDGAATSRHVAEKTLALRAALAGTDLLLLTGPDSASTAAFTMLVAAATSGQLSMDALLTSYDRILALKASLTP